MVEKGGVDKLKDLKLNISQVQLEIDQCERIFDLNKAAELKYLTLPQQMAKFEQLQEAGSAAAVEERMLRDEVIVDFLVRY
jgi:ATP-dependent Clp protease ATP-binding subunit ClpB